jgi:molybdopterin/thiamine biosynthesis adenylyltransferase/rhodanese-related sulfurtransferase
MSGRYARQTALPEIGTAGQERLATASVLVVGAGGLGCALLPYLAGAGIGRMTLLDPDCVEEHNLHRQPLYRMSDLGAPKVEVARAALLALNPSLEIRALRERLSPANAASHCERVEVVVDAADSFAVTYTLSDECRRLGRPLVSASVLGQSGYAGVFCGGAPSYRAVFPDLPRQAATCAETGVLGTAVGVLGVLEAQLTLALLLGFEPSVRARLVSVDLRTLRFGGFSFAHAPEPADALCFIAAGAIEERDLVIDLRGELEAPRVVRPGALRLSAEQLERESFGLARDQRIVLCCRSGLRAWRAGRALQRQGYQHLALLALGS